MRTACRRSIGDSEVMATPILYVKRGCPYCEDATEYLDENGIAYESVEVRSDPEQMQKLKDLSGQSKTPTMVWDGDVLANFGVEELSGFVDAHRSA